MGKKRFDASLKHLLEKYPQDWLAYLAGLMGLPTAGPVAVVEAELSTVSAAADKVFRVGGDDPFLLHLELQASHDRRFDRRVLVYNVLLTDRQHLPVRSVVLLLRPEADRGSLTGVLRHECPPGHCYLEFRYTVVRLWEQPVEPLLTGGLGLLPLAPLADVPADDLENVIARIQKRVGVEASPAEANNLWTAAYVLLGLQYSEGFASQLFQRVRTMEESATYQAIVAQGRAEGVVLGQLQALRAVLLDLGSPRFGEPDEATRAALEAITEPQRLRELARRLQAVSSWAELLDLPPSRRRKQKP